MVDFSGCILGDSGAGAIPVETRQEHADAALALASQARQKIAVISPELDAFVYDRPEYVDAVKSMVLGNRRAEVRIVVMEAGLISQRGHSLLDLGSRLSSFIELRRAAGKYRFLNEAMMIVDEVGYLFRENREHYRGKASFDDRRESRALLDLFNSVWEPATPDPNLRRMMI